MAKADIGRAQTSTKQVLGTAQQGLQQYATPAGQGYGDFATTGGVTPQQQALTRQRTQRGVSSLYDAMQQNLQRKKRVQGGYSPGYGANQRALGRDTAAATGAAVGDTELGLLQQIREGRLAGLGGLTNLAGLYGGMIPSVLGIQGKLAQAKPGWMDMMQQGLGLAGDVAGVFA